MFPPEMATERRLSLAPVTLAASLAVPSVGLVQKYLGYGGTVAYVVGVYASVVIAYRALGSPLATRLSERGALVLLIATFAALIGVFAVVHPTIDYTKGDANEALNYAVRELLDGHYPTGCERSSATSLLLCRERFCSRFPSSRWATARTRTSSGSRFSACSAVG